MAPLSIEPLRGTTDVDTTTFDVLATAIGKLGDGLVLEHLPLLGFQTLGLDEAANYDVLEKAYTTLQAAVQRPKAPATTKTSGGPTPAAVDATKRRRTTKQQTTFLADATKTSDAEALAAIKNKHAESTADSYDSALQTYLKYCKQKPCAPFPCSIEQLQIYAGHLKLSSAYKQRGSLVWAVVDKHNQLYDGDKLESSVVGDIVDSMTKEESGGEQAFPCDVDVLAELFGAVQDESDFDGALSLSGSTLCLARVDSFLHTRRDETTDPDPDRVRVVIRKRKGRAAKNGRPVEFERLDSPRVFACKFGNISFCPVFIFRLMRSRAAERQSETLCRFSTYAQIKSCMDKRLFPAAGIAMKIEGRDRKTFTPHSTRVGGVCMLLAAGLAENTVSTVADWESNMVKHYAQQVVLRPSMVRPVRFYNPKSLAKLYNGAPEAQAG